MRLTSRRALWAPVVFIAASALLAACSSSGTTAPAAAGTGSAGTGSAGTGSAPAAGSSSPAASGSLKTGLKIFVIPKNLGNPYFTTSDSVNSGGALAALQTLGETGQETSGTAATPASQLPAIQAATGQIGTSEVDLLAKQLHDKGEIAIVSAAASATNQNAWIGYMKQELAKYPQMKLVSIVYGNDDPTTATQVTEGLLEQYPDLAGIISPTTVGILAAAQVLDTPKYRGKIALTGLGTPDSLKKFVADGTIQSFELWNPANLGYLAAYAAVELASKAITNAQGQSFSAGKLGSFTVGADDTILLGPPFVFDAANINQFNF